MKMQGETIEACLANLRALEAVKKVDLTDRANGVPAPIDGQLVLHTEAGRLTYWYELKRNLSLPRLDHLLLFLERYTRNTKAKPLLLSDYISPGLAERLIRARVNFADAAGNVYLHWPPKLHIQIQGAKPKQLAEAKGERLSQPSGLKVLYALLTQAPGNWGAYRDIAKAAGVALGSVAWVIRELKEKGYLVQKGHDEWRLIHKSKLLDLWVGGYGTRLRPSLIIGRYQPPEADLERALQVLRGELEIKQIALALTGGFAADILTRHFRGEQLSFFAQDWSSDVAKRLKWLPSEHGRVTALRKFSPLVAFNLESPNLQPVAHPLLVYAELMFQGRERELETAGILYDRYLSSLVHEDGP
ncbi:MAG: type IV toxin-antitoxin system AbiEi family antitoxin [Gammaproteobacteria bacterium]